MTKYQETQAGIWAELKTCDTYVRDKNAYKMSIGKIEEKRAHRRRTRLRGNSLLNYITFDEVSESP